MTTVSDAITLYRSISKIQRWSHSKQAALHRIDTAIGPRDLATLDHTSLISWALARDGSILTADHMLATLGGCLSTCREILGVEVPHPTATQTARRALRKLGAVPEHDRRIPRITDDTIGQVIDRWTSRIPPEYLYVLVDTAMRSGELCRLLWEDVDLRAGIAIIRDRKHPVAKWGNDQEIPLLGRSREILMALRRPSGRACPYPRETLSSAFRGAAARAGYELHLHDLRHEGISRLVDRGWSIPQVAKVSGHRSWRTLRRYTHVTAESLLELEATTDPQMLRREL